MHGALKFNGGGHLNHSIFWQNLCPGGSGDPEGDLAAAITRDFGSLQAMKDKLSASTVAVQVISTSIYLFCCVSLLVGSPLLGQALYQPN